MAASSISSIHYTDRDGHPSGGYADAVGVHIYWQAGPLVVDGVRQEQNGAFVEDVIAAAIDRLEYYQRTEFACAYNELALDHLQCALTHLGARTADREARGVEGTHQV